MAAAVQRSGLPAAPGIGVAIPTGVEKKLLPTIDREACRERNAVKRLINEPNRFHAVATRHEKRAATCWASVVLAAILVCALRSRMHHRLH